MHEDAHDWGGKFHDWNSATTVRATAAKAASKPISVTTTPGCTDWIAAPPVNSTCEIVESHENRTLMVLIAPILSTFQQISCTPRAMYPEWNVYINFDVRTRGISSNFLASIITGFRPPLNTKSEST